MATEEKVNKAFAELEKAKDLFVNAIEKFKTVYDPDAVGLGDWIGDIDDTMFEIDADITEHFER